MENEKTLVVQFKLGAKSGFLILAFALLCCSPRILGSETLTLTTYYPAPYGAYVAMLTTRQTLLARDGGNVGIGRKIPASRLDVNGEVQLGNTNSDCTVNNEGALRYNSAPAIRQVQFCDGVSGEWKPLGGGGNASFTYWCYCAGEVGCSSYSWGSPHCNYVDGSQGYCPSGYTQERDLGYWGYCYNSVGGGAYSPIPPGGIIGTACHSYAYVGRAFVCSS